MPATNPARSFVVSVVLALGLAACGSAGDASPGASTTPSGPTTTHPLDAEVPAALAASVRTAAALQFGSSASKIAVGFDDSLSRAGCTGLAAFTTDRMHPGRLNFVVLPDQRLAGDKPRGDAAVVEVVRRCGTGASADWWAYVITSLSDDVGGLPVRDDTRASANPLLRRAGIGFAPPTITVQADGATEIWFHAFSYDVNQLVDVRARLGRDDEFTATVTKLATG